ncbi:MAG: DUF488 domain-containing protein [Proteobacteria bacterium]|nr:DUF488 domain-containing protein [Pseudomonadota bacterium]
MTIYTIGHSNRSLDHFADLLRQHDIATLVDVRSRPYSKYVPHFTKQPLSQALSAQGFRYVFLGDKLGGKLGDEYRDAQGNIDYRRRAVDPDFIVGIDKLIAIAEANPTAFMCAEEDPRRCHRRLLVTPALVERNVEVMHIRGDGDMDTEAELRQESPQMSLF